MTNNQPTTGDNTHVGHDDTHSAGLDASREEVHHEDLEGTRTDSSSVPEGLDRPEHEAESGAGDAEEEPKQENRRVEDRWSTYSRSQIPLQRSQGVHRDYGAHFFRWSAAKRLVNPNVTVLDVGCGRNLAFARVLGNPHSQPKSYMGIDLNKIPVDTRPGNHWLTVHDETNALEVELNQTFDLVVCFEVIEHMHKRDGEELIKRLIRWTAPSGKLLMSTPVFIQKKAADHIYEWSREEIIDAVRDAGGLIVGNYGTFARIPELKKVLTPPERSVFDRLAQYYDVHALSLIFAPLHPRISSNNIWEVRRSAQF